MGNMFVPETWPILFKWNNIINFVLNIQFGESIKESLIDAGFRIVITKYCIGI